MNTDLKKATTNNTQMLWSKTIKTNKTEIKEDMTFKKVYKCIPC